MPAFLVHGVPDTSYLWTPLRQHLTRQDVIAPDLPGFGTPIPAGFGATADEYADWLAAEISGVGEPVDLVGVDWGSLLAVRVAALRPELVRTLACGNAPVDREYRWHDMAAIWQTPGAGEAMMDAFGGELAVTALTASGMTPEYARAAIPRIDGVMKDAILKLYRSAIDIGARWEPALEHVRCPTLVVWSVDDPFVEPHFGERLAARLRGQFFPIDGGHFWPLQRPQQVARALETLWASVNAPSR